MPCSSSGTCSLRDLPCSRFPWGFSGHRVSVLLLPWCRRLGISPSLLFLCFSCSDWLAGVSWVLHPVSGCSSWGGVCSLVDGVVTLLAFPYRRVGELLDCCLQCQLAAKFAVSTALRGSFTFSCLCLSFTFSGVGVAWSQVCDPYCGSWVLDSSGARLRRPDALASGCTLSFSHRGFLPWALVGTWFSWQRSCLGSYLLLEVFSFPCPGFRWAVPAVWWSRHLLFFWNLTLGSSLSLPVFADGLRWLGFILGCPPSVASLWRLLP